MEAYPLAEDLSKLNTRNNAEIREIEELLITILNEKGLRITDNRLNYKYQVWRRLGNKYKRPFSNWQIRKCINKVLRQYSSRDLS